MSDVCPVCGRELVHPFGRPRSPVLLVGEFPGPFELINKIPWSGEAGRILREELLRAGIQMEACRATNLWLHEKPVGSNDRALLDQNKRCFDWCFGKLLEQMTTAGAILMMGSDLAPIFTDKKVSKINGVVVRSRYVSNSTVIVASFNPAICLSPDGVVGDFRFAVEQFAKYAKPLLQEARNARR